MIRHRPWNTPRSSSGWILGLCAGVFALSVSLAPVEGHGQSLPWEEEIAINDSVVGIELETDTLAWEELLSDSTHWNRTLLEWEKDTLDVLVLLPFGLFADTLEGGSLSRKAHRLREIALETLHGLEFAARELGKAGLPLNMQVRDEMPDSTGGFQWTNMDLANSELVIGPMLREHVGVLAPRIDRYGCEHILLTDQPNRYVQRGPAVRQVVPEERQAIRMLAESASDHHGLDRVMLLVVGGENEGLERDFMERFNAEQRAKWVLPGDSLRYSLLDTVSVTYRSVEELSNHLDPSRRNVVVGVAGRTARSMWAALQTELQIQDDMDIVLMAHPVVGDLPFWEVELMEKWRMTLPMSSEVSWSDSSHWDDLELYRMTVGSEPGEYTLSAHDALIDAGIRRHGWLDHVVSTWGDPFDWGQPIERGAWINMSWTIVRFNELQFANLESVTRLPVFVEE